jgi:hypothetical protein
MRNPNRTTTSMTETSERIDITFQYTSASMVRYDMGNIRSSYPNATICSDEKMNTITVTVWKGAK